MTALAATIIFAAFVGLAPFSLSAAAPTDVVVIAPGEDIQALVDANLPGTSYLLLTGIHHLQSVEPKDGDSFTGERGAAMSGAVELGPIERRDQHWSAPAPRATAAPTGQCATGADGAHSDSCTYLEDVFIELEPLRRVTNPAEIGPGTWYFDYDAEMVILADDPQKMLQPERNPALCDHSSGQKRHAQCRSDRTHCLKLSAEDRILRKRLRITVRREPAGR